MPNRSRGCGQDLLQGTLQDTLQVMLQNMLALFGLLAGTMAAFAQGAPVQQPYQQQQYQPPAAQPVSNQPAANQTSSNPVCVRLQGQLASVDQGAADPARAEQIKRSDDAIAKQQADLDRAVAQAHKAGCAGEGFFALFSALSPQCGPITSSIQQMRGNLDRMMSEQQQLKTGTDAQDGQRRALIGALAQNNCGAQYASAASSSGPTGFFDALFGNGTVVNPSGDGAPSGTFHTVCVRTCDGFYFPISYSTASTRFADDEKTCQRLCPASEVALYSFRNPGEGMDQAVSNAGQLYTALPNAYRYRKEVTAGCSCRKAGQSWGEALKNADDSTTLEQGDIVVTDQTAKSLSQAPKQGGKAAAPGASQPIPASGSLRTGDQQFRHRQAPRAHGGTAVPVSGPDAVATRAQQQQQQSPQPSR